MAESTIVSNTANVSSSICLPPACLLIVSPQLAKYLQLPQKGKITAEYVWIDGSNGVRSKSRVSIFSLFLFRAVSFPTHVLRRRAAFLLCQSGAAGMLQESQGAPFAWSALR